MNLRWGLWMALILLAGGALLLHMRVHPLYLPINPGHINKANLFASLFPLIDLVLITALFMSPKTAAYGYLLNGIFAIYGAVLMGHLSIYELIIKHPPFITWIFTSTLPDILIAWGDFFVGCALFYVLQLPEFEKSE